MNQCHNFQNKPRNCTTKEFKPKPKPISKFQALSTKLEGIPKSSFLMVPSWWIFTIKNWLTSTIQPWLDQLTMQRKVSATSNVTEKKAAWISARPSIHGLSITDLPISIRFTSTLTFLQSMRRNNDWVVTWSYKTSNI